MWVFLFERIMIYEIFSKPENQKAPSSVIIPIEALELSFSELPLAFITHKKDIDFFEIIINFQCNL